MIGPNNCQLIHLITPEILADVVVSEPRYERLSLSSPKIDRLGRRLYSIVHLAHYPYSPMVVPSLGN